MRVLFLQPNLSKLGCMVTICPPINFCTLYCRGAQYGDREGTVGDRVALKRSTVGDRIALNFL